MPSLSIGKYRLLDQIGAGAMGEVYRAHDSVLDRPVALKIITAGDDEKRVRFRREAQSAARLTHPNIVTVHDFGEDSGRFFMAMELLDGFDLKRAIAANHLPDLRSRLAVMEQMCDALAFAHAMNIVHRDLKPANVFVLPSGQVKILDFGLARVGQSSMTGTGTVLGTPNYMSPEQIKGHKVDPRADIFALGSVFYELLSGQRPFEGDSLHAVLYRVLQHEPEPLHVVAPAIPRAISDVIARAMAKDPALRFQSATELRDAIRRARDGNSSMMQTAASIALPSARMRIAEKPLRPSEATIIAESMIAQAQSVPVTFAGEIGGDVTLEAARGRTILEVSLENGIPHAHACGGNARCSTCRVAVLSGIQNLSPRTAEETKLARRLNFPDDVRLACQTRVGGAVRMRRLIRDEEDASIVRSDSGARNVVTNIGSEMPLAILHASVREPASITRGHLAHDVVHILNRYYTQVGDAILSNGGAIDRYDGTTIVAYFGLQGGDAKTKCTNAVRAALRMQKRMELFDAYLSEHFGITLTLDTGLHYGRMIVGHLGHPEHAKLTAIGEAANVAGALAAMNESHGSHLLATEELVNVVEAELRLGHVSHDMLPQREVSVYEIVDFAKPDVHELVQTSFEIVYAKKEEAAATFYAKLFELAPEVRSMFSRDMRVQGEMLMNMLSSAIRGLDKPEEIKAALQDLGRRHVAYGVQIQHYAIVEACLLYMIEAMAGAAFNVDVKLAWTAVYNFIAQTMIEATL